jgi:undecaprenyl-phosphate 4-deoxy-4-formamido-L-arabinose transferase
VLARNVGQHLAILAGLEHARGEQVITLDADLQNPPSEIPRVVEALDAGADYVGTIRRTRQDAWWRRFASRTLNRVRERTTRIHLTDQGCMLRAYDRRIVDLLTQCHETNTFIPALAYTFSRRPVEIVVEHDERAAGRSKYSIARLVRLELRPHDGIFASTAAGVLGRGRHDRARLDDLSSPTSPCGGCSMGPEAQGVFTLFGIAFFLIGVLLMGLGIVGEYVGRIYEQVRDRPRYVVASVLSRPSARNDDTDGRSSSRTRTSGQRCLEVLLSGGVDVRAVVTHPDDPAEARWFADVVRWRRTTGALSCDLSAWTSDGLRSSRRLGQVDFVFSFYFRQLLPAGLLALGRRGALNLHGSLAAKVPWPRTSQLGDPARRA